MERGPLKAEIVTVRSCRAISATASSSAQSDREHGSFAASACLHEARSQRDDPRRFFEGKDAGDAGGRDLTHAVADDGRRLDAPGFPKRRERHLHGKNGRAAQSPSDASGDVSSARPSSSRSEKLRPRTQRGVATLDRSRNTGSCCINSRPIPHHCGPWPLMMKPMRGACSGRAVKAVRIFGLSSFFANASSSSVEFRPIASDQSQPMRMMVPPGSQGVSEIRQNGRTAVGFGVFLHPCAQFRC